MQDILLLTNLLYSEFMIKLSIIIITNIYQIIYLLLQTIYLTKIFFIKYLYSNI